MQDTATQWFRITGTHILEGYGLSETSPVVASNPVNVDGFTGSIGLPLPSTEISLRDDAGAEVPVGEPGELCVRGPQVMTAYWNQADETAAAMTSDGFLKTGDIASIDENGFFRICSHSFSARRIPEWAKTRSSHVAFHDSARSVVSENSLPYTPPEA